MMRASQGRIRESRTGPDNNNRLVVVTNIYPDLFDAAVSNEISDGITNRSHPGHRQACRYADHVRLSDPAVIESSRTFRFETFEEAVADISREQDDSLVLDPEFGDFVGESVPHRRPSSRWAAITSSRLGMR